MTNSKTPDRALSEAKAKDPSATLFVLRHWDGFDGDWMDVTTALPEEEVKLAYAKATDNGTKQTHYNDIDYYAIYPATVRMVFADGNSMTRGS